MEINYRSLRLEEIVKYRKIDRSEVIDEIIYYRDGKLVLRKEHYDMKGFPESELDEIIERQKKLMDEGGSGLPVLYGQPG